MQLDEVLDKPNVPKRLAEKKKGEVESYKWNLDGK